MRWILCVKVALTSVYTIVVFGSMAGFWFTVAYAVVDHEYVDNVLKKGGWDLQTCISVLTTLSLFTTVCSIVLLMVGFCKGWIKVDAPWFTLEHVNNKACKMVLLLSLMYLLLTWLFIPLCALMVLGLMKESARAILVSLYAVLAAVSVFAFWYALLVVTHDVPLHKAAAGGNHTATRSDSADAQADHFHIMFVVCVCLSLLFTLISVRLWCQTKFSFERIFECNNWTDAFLTVSVLYLCCTWGFIVGLVGTFLFGALLVLWCLLCGLFLIFILITVELPFALLWLTSYGIFWSLIGLYFPLSQSHLFVCLFLVYMCFYFVSAAFLGANFFLHGEYRPMNMQLTLSNTLKVALTTLYMIVVFSSMAGFWFNVAYATVDHEYVDNVLMEGGWALKTSISVLTILSFFTTVCSIVLLTVGFCKGWIKVDAPWFTLEHVQDRACKMVLQLSLMYLLLTWLFIPSCGLVVLWLTLGLLCCMMINEPARAVLVSLYAIVAAVSACAFWYAVWTLTLPNIKRLISVHQTVTSASTVDPQAYHFHVFFLVCVSLSLLFTLSSVLALFSGTEYGFNVISGIYMICTWALLIYGLGWTVLYVIFLIVMVIVMAMMVLWSIVCGLFLPFIMMARKSPDTLYGLTAYGIFWSLVGLYFPLSQSYLFLFIFWVYMCFYFSVSFVETSCPQSGDIYSQDMYVSTDYEFSTNFFTD